MPVTLERLVTYQVWREFLASTTSDEIIDLVAVPIAEAEAFTFHLFCIAKTATGSAAAYYDAEALFARETGGNVRIAAGPTGHQNMDGDFAPQDPDVVWDVDVGTQSALVQFEGLSGVPLLWIAQVLVIRRI
jgi:hypothetical protein